MLLARQAAFIFDFLCSPFCALVFVFIVDFSCMPPHMMKLAKLLPLCRLLPIFATCFERVMKWKLIVAQCENSIF